MICRTCGRPIVNEQANFCEYCGTPVDEKRGDRGYEYAQGNPAARERMYGAAPGRAADTAPEQEMPQGIVGTLLGTAGGPEKEGSMTTLHWIVIMLLPYIPMVGTFAYLVVLLVWAFGRTASKSRRSWARATLIVLVVAVAMVMYMFGGMMENGSLAEMLGALGMPE